MDSVICHAFKPVNKVRPWAGSHLTIPSASMPTATPGTGTKDAPSVARPKKDRLDMGKDDPGSTSVALCAKLFQGSICTLVREGIGGCD